MNTTDANALFVTAARKKFRFETSKGGLNTEDLFDLSLESLDAIAVNSKEETIANCNAYFNEMIRVLDSK